MICEARLRSVRSQPHVAAREVLLSDSDGLAAVVDAAVGAVDVVRFVHAEQRGVACQMHAKDVLLSKRVAENPRER